MMCTMCTDVILVDSPVSSLNESTKWLNENLMQRYREVGCNLNHPVVYCLVGVVASCFSTNISREIPLNIHFLCKLLAIHH